MTTSIFRRTLLCLTTSGSLALAGCATSGSPLLRSTQPVVASSATLRGRIMGGQQPVSNATIQLYAVSTTADGAPASPLLTATVTSDVNGVFVLDGLYTCPTPTSTPVYITATGGNPGLTAANPAIALMTALGPCSSLSTATTIVVDERTTVAAVAALAPFMTSFSAVGSSPVDAAGLTSAFTLAASYINSSNGQVPGSTLPANAVAPLQLINTLADALAACINSDGSTGTGSSCGSLFSATTASGGIAPADTIAAALNLMRDPITNAAAIYTLSTPAAPFQPQLTAAPADWTVALSGSGAPPPVPNSCSAADLTGAASFTSFPLQQPDVCRLLRAADLPAPDTSSSSTNYSTQVARASNQMPVVPPGFKVTLYATNFGNARYLLTAANGDLLLSQPGAGSIVVLRGVNASGGAVSQTTFASGLTSPYGMAFYPSAANPTSLYVANTASIVRFPYTLGDTTASAPAQTLATDIPDGGNHTTRGLVFTTEAIPRLLVSVGSADNVNNTDQNSNDYHRANILAYTPAGVFQSIYASGLRNPVGLILDAAGRPWTSVNERDGLGDNVPAEYVTHVQESSFYGWPWYYNGPNPDPRLPSVASHPELQAATVVGDTLLQPHFAPLQINFYTGTQFPAPYRGDLFVASHGSWNKALRAGYEVVRVRMNNGNATGEYEDFMTGFVNPDGTVWGRPAGVAVGTDGALYIADDASNSIWRVTYTGH